MFHEVPASSDVFVWCRDVTATVMAAEAMQSSVLHSALVEHTRSLLAVFELDGRLRFLNPAALEMFEDACRDAGPNATLADLVHPDDVAEMLARFAEAVSAPRRRIPCELRIRRKDEWRTLQVVLVNLIEDPGVRGVVMDGVDATEQLDLAHRALHDPLTGVANRVLLTDRLTHSMSRLDRSRRPLMVAYVDLDRFKSVNDKLGHDMGDAVLVEVASRLTVSVRPGDTVARLGGDEFVIVCPDLPDAEPRRRPRPTPHRRRRGTHEAGCGVAGDHRERRPRARPPHPRRRPGAACRGRGDVPGQACGREPRRVERLLTRRCRPSHRAHVTRRSSPSRPARTRRGCTRPLRDENCMSPAYFSTVTL